MATGQRLGKAAEQAALVFTGRVVKPKAATIEGIGSDLTAIVEVDHVVTAPAMFSAITGAQITVRFKTLPVPAKGASFTFYTNGWVYGQGIAVDAVAVQPLADKPQMAAALRSSHSALKDGVLKARLSSARMAVVGQVTAVHPAEVATTHISEHDPLWHEATIQVDEVVKGTKGTRQVKVLFPQSDDVRWHKVRKYTAGQQGIWLMHEADKQDAKGLAPKIAGAMAPVGAALTSVHSADFLSLDELGRVKALLKS